MDLKSGVPFWAIKNGLMHAFPPLQRDTRCEVAVIGGGITGALVANELAEHGHEVVLVDGRDIGWGSTAASTALLQYEIDTHLTELTQRLGEDRAVLAYRACAEAVNALAALAREVREVGFARADSLYFASRARHRDGLLEEFVLRQKHGLPVQWLEEEALRERYAIEAPAAILSTLGGRIDPYRMTYRLLARLQRRGVGVFDRTHVSELTATARGVRLLTRDGVHLRAEHAVLAGGYTNQQWLKQRVARNHSSYAYVTEPMERAQLGPLAGTLVWETARPYLYLRDTSDNRLLIGGNDDRTDIPARRDARVDKKARQLHQRVQAMFPQLDLEPTFAWAGTFAETDDGLPFFGPHAQYGPRLHFAMAYGGNGITYSMIGAELLRARIERRRHPLAALFSFDRLA